MTKKVTITQKEYAELLLIKKSYEKLAKDIASYFVDDDGDEIEDDDEGDGLISIGETAASHFGWL